MTGRHVLTFDALRHPDGRAAGAWDNGTPRMSEHYDHPEIADRIKALEGVRGQIETALTW